MKDATAKYERALHEYLHLRSKGCDDARMHKLLTRMDHLWFEVREDRHSAIDTFVENWKAKAIAEPVTKE